MIIVLEELTKHEGILSQFLMEQRHGKDPPLYVKTMRLVDLMEAKGIMKNPYIEVKCRSIAPMMEDGSFSYTQQNHP
jgi:hypothetical protein